MSTPAVGSSRISRRGRCIIARARISRRFIPPDSVRVRSSRFSVSEKVSSSSFGPLAALALGHPEVAGVVVERLLDGQEPVEVRLLRRQPDRLARVGVVLDRVVAEDLDLARGRLREPGRAVDQRRLAGAVGAQQAEELARLDLERDSAQRLDPGRVALDEVLDVEGVVARPSSLLMAPNLEDRWPGRIGEAESMSDGRPLLVVDTPSMLFRAFYALPKSIVGPGREPGQRAARRGQPDPPRGRDPRAARRRPLLRARRRLLPHRALPGLPRRAPRGAGPALPAVAACRAFFEAFGWTVAASDDLEADDLLGTYARREAEAGGRALILTGDRDMYQCATERSRCSTSAPAAKAPKRWPRGGARALRHRPGAGARLHRPARRPLRRAARRQGRRCKTAADLLRKHGDLETLLDNAIREPRPKLRDALIEQREELLAFKDIATLRDAGVERAARPADRLGGRGEGRPRTRHAQTRRAADRGRGLMSSPRPRRQARRPRLHGRAHRPRRAPRPRLAATPTSSATPAASSPTTRCAR